MWVVANIHLGSAERIALRLYAGEFLTIFLMNGISQIRPFSSDT